MIDWFFLRIGYYNGPLKKYGKVDVEVEVEEEETESNDADDKSVEETESNDSDDKSVGINAGPIEICDEDFYEDGDEDEYEYGLPEESYSNFMNTVLKSDAHTSLF